MAQGDTKELHDFLGGKSKNPAFDAFLEHMLDGARHDIGHRRVILGELLELAAFAPRSGKDAVRLSLDTLVDEDLPVAQSRFERRFPGVFPIWRSVIDRETSPAWKAWANEAAIKLAYLYLLEGRS